MIAVRAEELFFRVDDAEAAFPGGIRIERVGESAYWAPDLYTLWFEHGESLYAIQVVHFEGAPEQALDVARDLAIAFVDRL